MEKEKSKQTPISKRFRSDRVKVKCSCCGQHVNKDGISDHYARKHPHITRREDHKFEEILPSSQKTLDSFQVLNHHALV